MTVADYLARWHLERDGVAIETLSSTLLPVRRAGDPAMLKVARPTSDELDTARILLHWGEPAVRVLEHDRQAILMERLVPGTPLTTVTDDDEATRIWCDVARALHGRPPPTGAPTVAGNGASFLHPWPVHPRVTHDLLDRAYAEYTRLCGTQSATQYLLHTDLHHENILRAGKAWRVIDPKGFAGELEYETGALLRNPSEAFCTPAFVERRVKILVDCSGLDGERILRWCFAQGILSALWCIEDTGYDAFLEGSVRVAESALAVLGQTR